MLLLSAIIKYYIIEFEKMLVYLCDWANYKCIPYICFRSIE